VPDVTVTPTTQTVTVNTGHVTINDPVFYDEFANVRYFQMFTHCLDVGQFKLKTGTNSTAQGSVTFAEEFDAMQYGVSTGEAVGIATLSTVSPSAYNALAELTAVADTNTAINGSFSIGLGDITFRARVKIDTTSTYTTDGMRFSVGIFRFHAEAAFGGSSGVSSGNPYEYAFAWVKMRDHATWRVLVSYYSGTAEEPVYNTYWVNTSVTIGDWHELRVDVPEDGSEARFYSDGALVQTITRQAAGNAFPPVYSNSPLYRFNPSVSVRDARITGENASNKAGVIYCDYALFQYETNYF